MTSTTINAASTMQEVLAAYPSAQRGLFTRYHIGGCGSCGSSSPPSGSTATSRRARRRGGSFVRSGEAEAVDKG